MGRQSRSNPTVAYLAYARVLASGLHGRPWPYRVAGYVASLRRGVAVCYRFVVDRKAADV